MNALKINVGMHGEFRLVVNEGTARERDYGWFDNLILDQGLEYLGTNAAAGTEYAIRYCRLGTGATAPANNQTVLDTQVAVSSGTPSGNSCTNEGAATYRSTQTVYWAFAQGDVVGNIAEIGVGWNTTGATLFSRALILDGNGDATTITLVAIDQLTVYYRLRFTPPLTDTTGTLTLSGTGYDYTLRIANVTTFLVGSGASSIGRIYSTFFKFYGDNTLAFPSTSTIGAITGQPSGSAASPNAPSSTFDAYTPASYTQRSTSTYGITSLNASGGIGAILVRTPSYISFQAVFDTPIPKDNTKTLTFGIDISWGRGP